MIPTLIGAAVLGFFVPMSSDSIWKAVPWSVSFKFLFAGAVYRIVTAATFAWLWP